VILLKGFRNKVVDFVKNYYVDNGRIPYISQILREVKINRIGLYKLFPGKLSEICSLAGVPVPINRIRRVEHALKGRKKSIKRRVLIDPKSRHDVIIADFKSKLKSVEYDAMINPRKIPKYVKLVVPMLSPQLWDKLLLLKIDDSKIGKAFSQRISFIELEKKAIVRNKKSPKFKEYVLDTLEKWLQYQIENKYCSNVDPSVVSTTCDKCGAYLVYGRDDVFSKSFREFKTVIGKTKNRLICPSCKDKPTFNCPICDGEMGFKPSILECERCGYRQKFRTKIEKEITLNYAIMCYLQKIDDTRLKGGRLVFIEKKNFVRGKKLILTSTIHSW
jgi:hypothetical protein